MWARFVAFLGAWWLYAALAAAIFALGWSIGSARKQHAWDAANTKAIAQAAEESERLAENANLLRKAHDREIEIIRDTLGADIERLRNRPDRVSRPAAVTCEGTTGKELSRPDAEFLTRFAADAKRADAEARACFEREDAYQKAMIGNRKQLGLESRSQ